ncbi:MAG: ABC transporter permease [Pseudomonadales bacterium]
MSEVVQHRGKFTRRLWALMRKESLQIVRDPSALLIAFVLPVMLLLFFNYAISLDVRNVALGVVLEGDSPEAHELAAAYDATAYIETWPARHRREVEPLLVAGDIKGFVVIPADFPQRLRAGSEYAAIQIITDASQPNTANFTAGYAQGVFNNWLAAQSGGVTGPPIDLQPRYWFNPELQSSRVLLPGAIAIVMTMIGTLLTALVVAREWERGTMEAIMSTPASMIDILLGKLLPYFALGLTTALGCVVIVVGIFDLPLRGSVFSLVAMSAVFMFPALGQGLLISSLAKNQFIASQIALISGFLPALLLSGFLFEIDSMPGWIQVITHVVAAKYYVQGLQTIFLAGDIWSQLLPNMLALVAIGTVFFGITLARTRKSLD